MTRFDLTLMPKDGSRHYHLIAENDLAVVPPVGSLVGLDTDYGVTCEVSSVFVYPTCDPAVYVNLRPLFPRTAAEAEEIVAAARSYGWRTIG